MMFVGFLVPFAQTFHLFILRQSLSLKMRCFSCRQKRGGSCFFFFLNLIAIFCLFIVQLRTLIVRVNIEIWDLIAINFPFDFIVFASLVILSLTLQKCYPDNLLSVLTFFSLRYSTLLCRADLVVRNFFSLFSSWENFLFPLIMMDSFGSSSNLG